MKILITGGAGFIGSALIREIINNTNYSVMNIDKLTYAGNLVSLASINNNNRYRFEQIDICDYEAIGSILKSYQPYAIMHLAAESHVDRSISGPKDFIETNILGTFFLLQDTASPKYPKLVELLGREAPNSSTNFFRGIKKRR